MQFMNNLILDNFKRENNLNQLIKGKKEGFAIHPTTNETETQCSENGNKDIIPKNSTITESEIAAIGRLIKNSFIATQPFDH